MLKKSYNTPNNVINPALSRASRAPKDPSNAPLLPMASFLQGIHVRAKGQRPVVWKSRNMLDFCYDLAYAREKQFPSKQFPNYKLGSTLIYSHIVNGYELRAIADGGQRTVATLLYSASILNLVTSDNIKNCHIYKDIRDCGKNVSNYFEAKRNPKLVLYNDIVQIASNLIFDGRTHVITLQPPYQPKTKQQAIYNKTFANIMKKGIIPNMPKKDSKQGKLYDGPTRLLVSDYKVILNYHLKQLAKRQTLKQKLQYLYQSINYLANQTYVYVEITHSRLEAAMSEERSNSRGVEFQPNNNVFTRLNESFSNDPKLQDVELYHYDRFSSILNNSNKVLTDFMKAYTTISIKKVSKNTVSRVLSLLIMRNDTKGNMDLIKDFEALAPYYLSALDVSNSSFHDTLINNALTVLSHLRAKQFILVLLAMKKRNFNNKSIFNVLSHVIGLAVEHVICHEHHTKYDKVAYQIWHGKLRSARTINKALEKNDKISNKSMYESSAKEYQYKGSKSGKKVNTAVFALANYYGKQFGDFHDGRSIFADFFMNSTKYVPVRIFHSGIHTNLENNIGNWTLLEKGVAKSLQNGEMSTHRMKIALSKSKLNANQKILDIMSSKSGNNAVINKRKADFAKSIPNIL